MSFDSHQRDSLHSFSVDQAQFQQAVLDASHQRPILVDFWADWCAPCHQLAPHLHRVIDELDGRIGLAKVEVDEGENMKLAGHYRLRGFPTVILFQAGEERGRFSGSRSSPQVRHWLEEHLDREQLDQQQLDWPFTTPTDPQS
ncbi:thioredoxin family protein [Thiohalocapsa marina]|uniref:Thioredoxin family protein n=1 Tax=Thiohalocapsa marina TaxID=424902 RepID=A0A5M8FG71_9GAMM|nr:thioredoxin family protein [Thiohalocapsa marina]KAA6182920.1 thioredoxin family protein [Thiohalocapsa marina]